MTLAERVWAQGLLAAGRPVVVLLSGGRDSVCLLDVAVTVCGADAVTALHVDYGLRPEAAADAELCGALCERLGVPLLVHRPRERPAGNLQAWARSVRYAEAERIARERGADVAAGHTATDQVETVLYRLAASPGRRALLGMREREGRLVRPLLGVTREETAAHCARRGLPWRDDATNSEAAFARNRVRARLVPALRELHDAAEANVLRTVDLLRDEAEVLDAAVDAALRDAGWSGAKGAVRAAALAELPPALRRLAFQRLADCAAEADAPAVGARVDEAVALAARGGTRSLDLGGGLRAVVSYGELRVDRGDRPAPASVPVPAEPVALPVGSRVAWGAGEVSCELRAGGPGGAVTDGTLDAEACRPGLAVRSWRPGDRMRPLGLGGSRSLQDLFTDRKVPRAERSRLPVVVCGDEVAWVPGVATSERFRVTPETTERLLLAWRG